MKKILYITMCAAGLFSITSCSDYLETNSPSTVDADFVFSNMTTAHAAMGKKLKDALEEYEKCSAKISDSGQSIAVSAHQLVKLGIPKNPKKPLPDIAE